MVSGTGSHSIKNLMDPSLVGKTVFSFCITLVNAAHYTGVLEKMLKEIKDLDFDEEAIKEYKTKAKKGCRPLQGHGFHSTISVLGKFTPPPQKKKKHLMLPQSSCKSSCFRRVHAKDHASPEFMLPEGPCRAHGCYLGDPLPRR